VVATLRGERDIAVGNVIGSNIFNVLGVLGVSAALPDLPVNPQMATVDTGVMIAVSVAIAPLAFLRRRIDRPTGFLLLLAWVLYTAYLIRRSAG
jgi:cation:H+ antiporter